MDHRHYMVAVAQVLQKSEAKRKSARTLGRTVRLNGIPFKFVGYPIAGPQCVTVSLAINDLDLPAVVGLGERFAYRAGSNFARVYRDLSVVRIEFTLPPSQWREVRLSQLPHHRESLTIGQRALGPVARLDWINPHKAVFGGSQTGKTTCLADMLISLTKTLKTDELALIVLNPKNTPKLHPFARLPHLLAPIGTDYESCANLLRFALAQMEERRTDMALQKRRLVLMIDEVAQLTEVKRECGPIITQLTQMAAEMRFNVVAASQAANPSVFGESGSLSSANFLSRIVFQLPHDQSYLATKLKGQHTEMLGGDNGMGKGDGLAISGSRVIRFRAALPEERDFEDLPRLETEPELPDVANMAGDSAIREKWQVDPDRLAYALILHDSATAIQKQFGGGMDRARTARDYAVELRQRIQHWVQVKRSEGKGGAV
jgi:hypothetical protein